MHSTDHVTKQDANITQAFANVSTATAHEVAGRIGALSAAIKPIAPSMRLCGPAYPVRLHPGDNLALHYAIYSAPRGSVLVVDAFDYLEAGPFGEIMAVAAQVQGLAGLLTSGSVRDSKAIKNLGFPVFAKGVCIKGTHKYVPGQHGTTVVIDGIVIEPGDIILGDSDGVMVVPQAVAEHVAHVSQERDAKELDLIRRIRAGERTLDIYKFVPLNSLKEPS
jgi:4-hydroxy-4-methyl-2-oxoglutarate aldolase